MEAVYVIIILMAIVSNMSTLQVRVLGSQEAHRNIYVNDCKHQPPYYHATYRFSM